MQTIRQNGRLSALLVLAAIFVLSFLPMLRLLVTAIAPGGEIDLAAFAARLSTVSVMRATLNTLDTAFFGALLALLIGAPFA
ncbi:MAG: iron ABC transporter permease, partial [Pyrinomonadaceae bacterium]